MKKIILLILLFLGARSFAQTNGITYQAVILNPSGEQLPGANNTTSPLVDKNVCMLFQFIDQFSNIEYQETIQTKTDSYGMVNLIIGSGTQTGGYASSFETIKWSSLKKILAVSLSTSGSCNSFIEISNQPFTAVPFAFSAINAGNVTGVVAIVNGGTNATTVLGAKTNLGLEKVENTTDLNKPISLATANVLILKEDLANKSTSITADGTSDTKYPSVKSVKTYVDVSASSVDKSLAVEVLRAKNAEIANATSISNETSRAGLAELANTEAIKAEAAKARAAELTLANNLSVEVANSTEANLLKANIASPTFIGTLTAPSIVKSGGTAIQYLMADGTVSTGAVPVIEVADEFASTASQSIFTLSQIPSANAKVKLYINGIRISNRAYSWIGTALTYTPANNGLYVLSLDDRIQVDYYTEAL